jgi:hypothetical protein
VAQGVDFPVAITVWNDSSHWGLGIDTDWSTLNIFWGQMTGTRSKPYGVNGLIDVVRIFYQPGKGLYGLRFHDSAGQYYENKQRLFLSLLKITYFFVSL